MSGNPQWLRSAAANHCAPLATQVATLATLWFSPGGTKECMESLYVMGIQLDPKLLMGDGLGRSPTICILHLGQVAGSGEKGRWRADRSAKRLADELMSTTDTRR